MPLPENVLFYGSPDPLPMQIPLRAGPLSFFYDSGSLRHIRCGDREILLRIYVAVRDTCWGTVPGILTEMRREIREDSFLFEFQSEHQQDDIHFVWRGILTSSPEGLLTFTMDGEARATFRSNRIGLCILHPISLAGTPCTVEHADGSIEQSLFPEDIAPSEPFLKHRALKYEIAPGVRAEIHMEGDVFNTEDQRNWGDASYKTYSTLMAPFPAMVATGTKIWQSVTLRLLDPCTLPAEPAAAPRTISLLGQSRPLPPLGLCLSSQEKMLSTRAVRRLKALNLAHLRADLDFRKKTPILEQLRLAVDSSHAVGVPLELAVFLGRSAKTELETLCQAVDELAPRLARWLVFPVHARSTPKKMLLLAKKHLEKYGVPVGAGTNAYFAELNRARPPLEADLAVYSINPLVHQLDRLTMVENLAALGATVESARRFWGDKPLLVGPVTLRRRWNPDITGPQRGLSPGELPYQVDPRQMSLLGAAWTAASLRALIHAGADILTYYETIGWRGVMENEAGSSMPSKFPSIPGGVFPLYHVLADIAEMAGGMVEACRSSDPLAVDGLVLRKGTLYRTLAVNFTPQPQKVIFPEIGGRARLKMLDASNAETAMTAPDDFRSTSTVQLTADLSAAEGGGLSLDLPPFGMARLDWS